MNKTLFAYDHSASAYEKKFASYETYLTRIESFADSLKEQSSVLDMGCGPGFKRPALHRQRAQGHRNRSLFFNDHPCSKELSRS